MDLTTINNQLNMIKSTTESLIRHYKDIHTKLIEAYNIALKTNNPALADIKVKIDNIEFKINNLSQGYAEGIKIIGNYINASNDNCKVLDEKLLTISRDLMDAIETLK